MCTSFSYRFHIVFSRLQENNENDLNSKNLSNLLFACLDNLNNLWLLLHGFQKFAFSVKTMFLHDIDTIKAISFSIFPLWRPFSKVIVISENDDRFRSFSFRSKVKTKRKVCSFDENDMKTYSCRWGLSFIRPCNVSDSAVHKLYYYYWKWLSKTAVKISEL